VLTPLGSIISSQNWKWDGKAVPAASRKRKSSKMGLDFGSGETSVSPVEIRYQQSMHELLSFLKNLRKGMTIAVMRS
jgi:hypothetical protein